MNPSKIDLSPLRDAIDSGNTLRAPWALGFAILERALVPIGDVDLEDDEPVVLPEGAGDYLTLYYQDDLGVCATVAGTAYVPKGSRRSRAGAEFDDLAARIASELGVHADTVVEARRVA